MNESTRNPKSSQTPILSMLRAALQQLANVTQTFVPCPVCDSTGRITRLVRDTTTDRYMILGCTVSMPCPLCRPSATALAPDQPGVRFVDYDSFARTR